MTAGVDESTHDAHTARNRIITDGRVCVCSYIALTSPPANTARGETATRRRCVQFHTPHPSFVSHFIHSHTTTTLLHYYYNNNKQTLNYYTSITDSWGSC